MVIMSIRVETFVMTCETNDFKEYDEAKVEYEEAALFPMSRSISLLTFFPSIYNFVFVQSSFTSPDINLNNLCTFLAVWLSSLALLYVFSVCN